MSIKSQELIDYFQMYGCILRFSEIIKAGFHPELIKLLETEGEVEKIGVGLYKLTKYVISSHSDIIFVSCQAPGGVICLLSALSFHNATNEIPKYIDVAIPRGTHQNRIKYPPIKFYQLAPSMWKEGIVIHDIDGHKVKIYNLAKTVADCFKFRNRIGMGVARDALKVAISEHHVEAKKIMYYAKICRVDNVIKPILEAII